MLGCIYPTELCPLCEERNITVKVTYSRLLHAAISPHKAKDSREEILDDEARQKGV